MWRAPVRSATYSRRNGTVTCKFCRAWAHFFRQSVLANLCAASALAVFALALRSQSVSDTPPTYHDLSLLKSTFRQIIPHAVNSLFWGFLTLYPLLLTPLRLNVHSECQPRPPLIPERATPNLQRCTLPISCTRNILPPHLLTCDRRPVPVSSVLLPSHEHSTVKISPSVF